jgi:hypothetical protein
MKRIWSAVFLLLAVLLPACSAGSMTPEETVRYYFERMGKKDQGGMDSVLVEEQRGADAELDHLISVEMVSCVQEKDESVLPFQDQWYTKDAADKALVRAAFKIEYENGGGAGFDNGEYHWYFWLVKESQNSDWRIAMSGV